MSQIKKPPYNQFPFVSNGKIALRQIQTSDCLDLLKISFYDAIQAKTLEQAILMNARINQDYENGNSIHWGIVDQKSNVIVGTCGYYRGFANSSGELGCVLLPQFRGKGFMTAALLLAIDFGLNTMGLKRVYAITSQENDKAIKLFKSINFKKIRDLDDNEVEFEFVSK